MLHFGKETLPVSFKLQTKGLSFAYEGKQIFRDLDLSVEEGEFVSLLGPSGCGKSTLLNILTGILPADGGCVMVDGQEVQGLSPHFAYMPQQDLLLPWRTILDNVCLYGRLHGKEATEKARERALASMELFGLKGYESSYPSELSGGMRQRAAFLRTALCEADILLLDEPFGALDVITRGDMQDWLVGMREALGRTTLLVTHDIEEAIYLSDRILILQGSPAGIAREIRLEEKQRSREWLFAQRPLYSEIYYLLKGREDSHVD
ncbi:MAG: ABC transporter ATP-binding protein [Clostridia bacterium]|nr:ABC transporter ATP-binding protein [Clostridia bacterium]